MQVHDHGFGSGTRGINRFVVLDSNLEIVLGGKILHQAVVAIFKFSAWPVPVDDKTRDPKILSLHDLFLQGYGVARGVANIDVAFPAEPWLVGGQQHRPGLRGLKSCGAQRLMEIRAVA